MPSFRRSLAQAKHRISTVSAIGESKPAHGSLHIHSLGTQRTYATSISLLLGWAVKRRLGTTLDAVTEEVASEWLGERSEQVGQKCLDNDRVAIGKILGFAFPRIRSSYEDTRRLADTTRAYTAAQLNLVVSHQDIRNAFSTRLARESGLRAQELLTLEWAEHRPASPSRTWSPRRFLGLAGARYTVVGKGGLIREVVVPHSLIADLEGVRRARCISVRDRGISYLTRYDLAGGNAWSKSFSEASQRGLGYSHGAHGVRHSYVQARMDRLQQLGMVYEDALETVSQEVGHFRPDITLIYMR